MTVALETQPQAYRKTAPDFTGMIGESRAIRSVLNVVENLLDNNSTVLVLGESGVGKEVIAKAIHANSDRSHEPFVIVNCGAIPAELLESELFGHEKGSFTGAIRSRTGKFELADRGTIFLDEIGDMSPALQVKLLRVLQELEFERVGGAKTIKVDVRVIAATNQDLEKAVNERRFREDLFYRLNVIPIELPPLRARDNDVELLIRHFIKTFNRTKHREILGIHPRAIDALKAYGWPGNIREHKHMIERLVVLKVRGVIEMADLPAKIRNVELPPDHQLCKDMLLVGDLDEMAILRPQCGSAPIKTDEAPQGCNAQTSPVDRLLSHPLPKEGIDLKHAVDQYETGLIVEALERCGWVKNKAAKLLGLNRTTLVEKLKKKHLLNRETSAGAALP